MENVEYCGGKLVFLKTKIDGYKVRKCLSCGTWWIRKPKHES